MVCGLEFVETQGPYPSAAALIGALRDWTISNNGSLAHTVERVLRLL